MQQKPVVYLLVILPIFGVGGFYLVCALVSAHSHITGIPLSAVPNLNGMLISLPAFVLWTPVSLLLANLVLVCVAPLRRISQRHVTKAQQPGFVESQKALLKMLFVFALICIPLIVLGFIL